MQTNGSNKCLIASKYWAVMDCTLQSVVGCSGLCWALLGCNGYYLAVLLLGCIGCNGLYWALLDCALLYWAVMDCTRLYWTAGGCTRLYCTVPPKMRVFVACPILMLKCQLVTKEALRDIQIARSGMFCDATKELFRKRRKNWSKDALMHVSRSTNPAILILILFFFAMSIIIIADICHDLHDLRWCTFLLQREPKISTFFGLFWLFG